MQTSEIKPGDVLTWLYTPRGGYGYTIPVDARVVKVAAKEVQVEVQHIKHGVVRRWVRPENLKQRAARLRGEGGGE